MSEPGLQDALARKIRQIEQFVGLLLRGQRLDRRRLQRSQRLVIDPERRHRNQFPLRVAQGGQLAAEHAASIQADGVVEPLGAGHRRMAVGDDGPAAIVRRPVVAHWQAVLIGFAGGLAVQGEFPHRAGAAPVHLLAQPGVSHHQPAAVEHVMTDQPVQKPQRLAAEGIRFPAQLLQRFGQSVADAHLPAAQRLDQLDVVIADHAIAVAAIDRRHRQPQHVRHAGTAIHQIADQHQLPALRMRDPPRFPAGFDLVAKLVQQQPQLVEATVDIADDVEGAGFGFLVVPERLPLDSHGVHFRR